MMKCLILCFFLATIFNIAYSRSPPYPERSKTCTKWDNDGTKIVTVSTLKCRHCYIGGCTVYNTITTTFPNEETQDISREVLGHPKYVVGCSHQFSDNCDPPRLYGWGWGRSRFKQKENNYRESHIINKNKNFLL